MTFQEWWANYRRTGDICPVRLGCRRSDLVELWGDPDDVSASSKRGAPRILVYGELEFHFERGTEGRLFLIYKDATDGIVQVAIGGSLYDAG